MERVLYIYTNFENIQKDNYIHDIELFFEETWQRVCNHKEAKYVMKKIDSAVLISDMTIKTKFGITNLLNLSTGCKTLLIALTYNNSVTNFDAGPNVFDLALTLSRKYDLHIYLPRVIVSSQFNTVINVDGLYCTVKNYMLAAYSS